MLSEPRYAIFYTPSREDPLTKVAARWLGRDAFFNVRCDGASSFGNEIRTITAEPRRYGFHATLKAPFRLAQGRTREELERSIADFASVSPSYKVGSLKIEMIRGFFALVPTRPSPMLKGLASTVVDSFECFRAPLNAAERERRMSGGLDLVEASYTFGWGYPYVFDRFQFHMTLTDRVAEPCQGLVRAQLEALFSSVAARDHTVDALTLFEQAHCNADFTAISSFALKGGVL